MKILALVFVGACCVTGQTVEPEMTADRPGFRNSTHLIGLGVAQLESGLVVSGDRTLSWQPELRVGAFQWLELRLVSSDIILNPDGPKKGASDLQPGIKFPIFDRVLGTRIVGILKSTIPTGHSSQSSGGYEPAAELIWAHEVNQDLEIAGTWNLTRLRRERIVWQRAASVSASRSLAKKLETFVEAYVLSPVELGAGNQWSLDGGLTRVLGDHMMVDIAVGHSIHGPKDWFVTVGFSVRTRVPLGR